MTCLRAYAQNTQRPGARVVGLLASRSAADSVAPLAAFRIGLTETGYAEGRDFRIEFRWADNDYSRLPALAGELVALKVDVITATGAPAAIAARNATRSIPIVFYMGEDPVSLGLVPTLNHPGANVTGVAYMSSVVMAKRLELLHEVLPRAAPIAVLVNPKNPNARISSADANGAARAVGRTTQLLNASTAAEIEAAFAVLSRQKSAALLIAPDGLFNGRVEQLAALAIKNKIAASHEIPSFPHSGGLMSYGGSNVEGWRQTGIYTARILKGEKTSTLPIMQPTKLALVINLKTAKLLGLTVPNSLLLRADEVID